MGYTKQSLIKKSKLSQHKHTQKLDFQFTQSNELLIRIEVFLLQNSNYKINYLFSDRFVLMHCFILSVFRRF